VKRDQWDPILALGMGEDGWDAEVGGEEWQERVKAEVVFESVARRSSLGGGCSRRRGRGGTKRG